MTLLLLMTVISALVFSRLFYCSSVWGGISRKNVLKLESVQNFTARIITSTGKYDHIHPILRDNKDKLATPLCKTAAGQKSFVYRATSIWNSLSQDLINLNNLNSFKRLYKLSLLEQ